MIPQSVDSPCDDCQHHQADPSDTDRSELHPDCVCPPAEQTRRNLPRPSSDTPSKYTLLQMLQFIRKNGDQFGDQFYLSLFRQYPRMATRFSSIDRTTRQTALWGALDAITNPPETLSEVDEQLGTRQAASGVQSSEYAEFITVLIDTVADFLGAHFAPEVGATCADLLRQLSEQMTQTDKRN